MPNYILYNFLIQNKMNIYKYIRINDFIIIILYFFYYNKYFLII